MQTFKLQDTWKSFKFAHGKRNVPNRFYFISTFSSTLYKQLFELSVLNHLQLSTKVQNAVETVTFSLQANSNGINKKTKSVALSVLCCKPVCTILDEFL